jgi:hypothetical protein
MRAHSRFRRLARPGSAYDASQIPSATTNAFRLQEFPIYIGGLSSKMTDIYDRRAHISAGGNCRVCN